MSIWRQDTPFPDLISEAITIDNKYYNSIFKRKSFHLFRGVGNEKLTDDELNEIREAYYSFEKLCPDIRTEIRIVPSEQINYTHGAEYCILIYSENKENYLTNAGYIGEQLDLYLVSRNIATLWCGLGKPDIRTFNGLDYVIMMPIHKVSDPSLFRKDMFKAKRKPLDEIWHGDELGIAEIVRFSPSACNSQPWIVGNENNTLKITRYRKPGRVGLMNESHAFYYNRIDMGIFLCISEICMSEKGIKFERKLFADTENKEYSDVAEYRLK